MSGMSRDDVQDRSDSKAHHLGGAGLQECHGPDKVNAPQCCGHQVPVVSLGLLSGVRPGLLEQLGGGVGSDWRYRGRDVSTT